MSDWFNDPFFTESSTVEDMFKQHRKMIKKFEKFHDELDNLWKETVPSFMRLGFDTSKEKNMALAHKPDQSLPKTETSVSLKDSSEKGTLSKNWFDDPFFTENSTPEDMVNQFRGMMGHFDDVYRKIDEFWKKASEQFGNDLTSKKTPELESLPSEKHSSPKQTRNKGRGS